MINILKKNDLFGIEYYNIEVVPINHSTEKEAIKEFLYFQELNNRSRIKFIINHPMDAKDINKLKQKYNI
jgi:hypothetical protein